MAQRVDAGDRFLTQIAAFAETDGPIVAGNLLWQVSLGDVAAIQRKAGFDPRGLESRRTRPGVPPAATKASPIAAAAARGPTIKNPIGPTISTRRKQTACPAMTACALVQACCGTAWPQSLSKTSGARGSGQKPFGPIVWFGRPASRVHERDSGRDA